VYEDSRWLRARPRTRRAYDPLLVLGLCGATSILLDLDHLIAYLWLKDLDPRFLHIPVGVAAGLIFFGTCARSLGLLVKRFLLRRIGWS